MLIQRPRHALGELDGDVYVLERENEDDEWQIVLDMFSNYATE